MVVEMKSSPLTRRQNPLTQTCRHTAPPAQMELLPLPPQDAGRRGTWNALAALHASMALQRLSQAASALLCKRRHCLRPCLGQCAQEPGSQFLTNWKHGAGSRSMPSIMASAMVGWRFPLPCCAVCPAHPMRSNSCLHGTGQTQSSDGQWDVCAHQQQQPTRLGPSGTTQHAQCSSSPSTRGRKLGDRLARPTL